jgi:hypothetical protein
MLSEISFSATRIANLALNCRENHFAFIANAIEYRCPSFDAAGVTRYFPKTVGRRDYLGHWYSNSQCEGL